MSYFFLAAFLVAVLLIYFRIADHYSIIDKPNSRSSHSSITIRGGGIIFVVAAIITLCWQFNEFLLPALGIIIIGGISFLDDIFTLSNKVRVFFHVLAVTLMFISLSVFSVMSVYGIVGLYILVIGIINAYNFMDGINGITGLYSLVVLLGLQYVNMQQVNFVNPVIIWVPVIACITFLFFNFRTKAICFAGDVGSVTIAFWIILLLLSLIFKTGDWRYILFLAVYGVDTVLTIIHRLYLSQNIFQAHRFHFYQILVNENKVPHLKVASLYSFIQVVIIVYIASEFGQPGRVTNFAMVLLPLIFIYLLFKPRLMNKHS